METLLLVNLCAHRKGAIEELIKGRALDAAAQTQILFGKPTGDHDGSEELLVKLLTSFTEALSHLLMSSCGVCEVSQIPKQVRFTLGDWGSVDPGGSRKRPAAKNQRAFYKRRRYFRCTQKFDQGCQATERVQRIQEAPYMCRTTYFGHHTGRSCSVNKPSQNPLSEAHLLSFSSKTIATQDSESYRHSFSSQTISTQDSESYRHSFSSQTISTQYTSSFSSQTISTQYTSSCPSPVSSVRKECGEETIQSKSPDLEVLKIQDDLVHFRKDVESGVSAENLDVRIQDVLGHLRKDFERGVSAENLGPKFGAYGSFLPTYPCSPVPSPAKVHNFNAPTRIPKQSTPGDADAPRPARRCYSYSTINVVKEGKDLKHLADRLKNCGASAESASLYFQAAVKFLYGASLLESTNGESVKQSAMIQSMQLYSSTAKLFEFCAHEYEKSKDMAAAALAYKCIEVAYMRLLYSCSSRASRDWNDLQTALQLGESPCCSSSNVDNVDNLLSKGVSSPQGAGNHVMSAQYCSSFSRLLLFTQDVNYAMKASKKSRLAFAAANLRKVEAQYRDGITTVKMALDFGFQDVKELLHLVRLAMEAIGR